MNSFYIIICYHIQFYHSHGPRRKKVLHKSIEGGPNLQHKIKKKIEEWMNSRPSVAYRSTFLGVATMELVPLGHTRVISRSPRHGWVIVTNNCTCSRTNKFKPEMSFFVTTKCQTHVLLVINEILKKKIQLNNRIIAFIILNVYDNYSGTNFSKLAIW